MAAPPRKLGIELLNNRYPVLHGIRVLGILLVVQIHVTTWFKKVGIELLGPWQALSMNAWLGMDIFFVLSGFLIGTLLLHSGGMTDGRKLLRFYLRRSLRILPLYYVVLFLIAAIYGLEPVQKKHYLHELFYLTNYPFRFDYTMEWSWSLSLEEHFYLAVPVLIILLNRLRSHRARITALLVVWASALLVRLGVYALHEGEWTHIAYFQKIYTPTHTRYDTLVAGILIAYLHYHFRDRITAWYQHAWVRRVSLALPLGLLLLLANPFDLGADVVIFRYQWLRHIFYIGTVTTIVYCPLLLWALCAHDRWTRVLGSRAFLWIASLGYGIYLVHIPVFESLVRPLFVRIHELGVVPDLALWTLAVLVTVAVSMVVSWVLHVIFERPALWVRERFVP